MRRAWKLYDKCYCEISSIGGPFLAWAPELRCDTNGALSSGLDDVEEALDEVTINSLSFPWPCAFVGEAHSIILPSKSYCFHFFLPSLLSTFCKFVKVFIVLETI